MTEATTSEIHRPLQKDEIRLLQVDSVEELVFSLFTVPIQSAPKYAALSYTWGAPVFPETVRIDGYDFAVTANLKEALVNLAWRVKKADYHFWIDAICINQHDFAERSTQVQIMSSIYQQSAHVFVWLGKPEDETDAAIAMAKIDEVGSYSREATRSGIPLRRLLTQYEQSGCDPLAGENRRAWEAVARLSCQEWWMRAWIIQEATCSGTATLHYGADGVLLDDVTTAMLQLRRFIEDYDGMSSIKKSRHEKCIYLGLIRVRRAKSRKTGLQLRELMRAVRKSQCRDARDRLYAIMGIASDIPDWFVVDYTKSVADVYIDFVRYSMEASSDGGKLGFLGHCGANYYPEEESFQRDVKENPLPSWVPDWRGETLVSPLRKFIREDPERRLHNADNCSATAAFINGLELWMKGFCVSDIQVLGPTSRKRENPSLGMPWIREAPFSRAFLAENGESAMLRVLTADVLWSGSHAVSRGCAIDFSYEERDHNSLTPEERRKKVDIRESFRITTYNRRLLWTSNGHIGLAPFDAKVGDKICVFCGGSVLYIIRKNKEKPGYKFVGECYVDGFMDGEAAELLRDGSTMEEVFILV